MRGIGAFFCWLCVRRLHRTTVSGVYILKYTYFPMFYFILIVGWVILFAMIRRLDGRIRQIEHGRTVSSVPAPAPLYSAVSQTAASTQSVGAHASPQQPNQVRSEDLWSHKIVEWLKEDWLLKLGALLLLIGFGWLVTYAFMNNWIGPMGRIALGLIAGTAILAFGSWRMEKYVNQGGIFLALGSTVILLTTFAAREIYDFFTPLTALAVMFLSAAFTALASVRHKTQALAMISIILAGIAPLLTNSPSQDYVSLYWYLLVIICGIIWITIITGWRALPLAALILFTFYSIPHLSLYARYASIDRASLLPFEYAVAAILFIVTMLTFLKRKDSELGLDMVTAAGNGMLLLWWILAAAPREWRSMIIVAWMMVFIVGAFVVYRITKARQPFYIYAAVGITMLASATAVQWHGRTLVIAYAVECVAIALATYLVTRNVRAAERTSILFAVPVFLSLTSFSSSAWRLKVFHADFAVLFIMGVFLLGMGMWFREMYHRLPDSPKERWYPTLIIAGSIYAFGLLWLSLHAGIQKNDTAVTMALFIYTLVGLLTYFYGKFKSRRIVQYYGGVVLGLVVLRLLAVDVWGMALAGRIVTFFLVGAMLMGTAFVGRRTIAGAAPLKKV